MKSVVSLLLRTYPAFINWFISPYREKAWPKDSPGWRKSCPSLLSLFPFFCILIHFLTPLFMTMPTSLLKIISSNLWEICQSCSRKIICPFQKNSAIDRSSLWRIFSIMPYGGRIHLAIISPMSYYTPSMYSYSTCS